MDSNNDLGKIVRDTDGKTMAIREKIDLDKLDKGEGSFPMQNGFAEVNSGIYAFDRNALFNNLIKIKKNKNKKEYFLTDIIEILYNEGHKVSPYVLNDNEEIFGINTRRDLYIAEGMLRKRIVESYIDRGVKIIDPQSTFIEDGVKIGKNTTIYPFTFIEKNVIIGNNCSLGPFLHLREGSRVLSSTHLGNFVEVCRSKLGREVTMKHFCYLGDTVVKDNVNIGAGTVVANFDGRKKNKTVIEKDAFIGSDTILVAPVKVGKGAKTGAGSVVTRNVKPKTVVVGVPAKELRKIKK
jgi:bifunctional UDP-N-acetylglucosamine pyrophosphorylase/glucosamine-1-phosphate N-acetyltransferase